MAPERRKKRLSVEKILEQGNSITIEGEGIDPEKLGEQGLGGNVKRDSLQDDQEWMKKFKENNGPDDGQ